MSYSYNNALPMINTSANSANVIPTTGTMMSYGTLGTYGNVNSYYTGGANSIFDTALKSQETNQTMTSQSMTNNYSNAYQGNVLAATATAQTAEVQKFATDICNLIKNNQLTQFKEKWEDFKTAVAQNSIYSQAIDTSDAKQVAAMAEQVFQQLTGYSIQNVLKNTSDNSFMNGVKSGASLSFWGSGTSQDDALAYLSETEVRTSSKFAEGIGGVVGGALTGGAGSMAVVGAVNGIATVFGGTKVPIPTKNLGKIGLGSTLAMAVVGLGSSIVKMNQDDNKY